MSWRIESYINNMPYSVYGIVDLAESDAGSQKSFAPPGTIRYNCNFSLVVKARVVNCHLHRAVHMVFGHLRDNIWHFLELLKGAVGC